MTSCYVVLVKEHLVTRHFMVVICHGCGWSWLWV